MRTLNVTDNQGPLGTLELHGDDSYTAEPQALAALVEARVQKGMTVEEAFADLDGWSDGVTSVASV